ncbi:hypothetical protein EON81_29095 [bacterium]|nr:MAG: hypothetical protein EON81_29095 [bacterium]
MSKRLWGKWRFLPVVLLPPLFLYGALRGWFPVAPPLDAPCGPTVGRRFFGKLGPDPDRKGGHSRIIRMELVAPGDCRVTVQVERPGLSELFRYRVPVASGDISGPIRKEKD